MIVDMALSRLRSGGTAFLALWALTACASKGQLAAPATPVERPIGSIKVTGACADADVRAEVALAESLAVGFATGNGWDATLARGTFDSVEVFDAQASLWSRILELNQLPPSTPMPTAGLVAGIESRVLVAVCPAEYLRLNPEYASHPNAWRFLLAHEIVHRLHVNILDGNDEAMGPSWFYEGFAVIGASQNLDEGLEYVSAAEALAAVHEKGPLAYRRYAAAVRFFMTGRTLRALVEHAGSSDFEAWLQTAPPSPVHE